MTHRGLPSLLAAGTTHLLKMQYKGWGWGYSCVRFQHICTPAACWLAWPHAGVGACSLDISLMHNGPQTRSACFASKMPMPLGTQLHAFRGSCACECKCTLSADMQCAKACGMQLAKTPFVDSTHSHEPLERPGRIRRTSEVFCMSC